MKPSSLVTVTLLLLACLLGRTDAGPGSLDLSFDPGSGVNNSVGVTAFQPDGKVIIGGDFTSVKGFRRLGLARLNADGSGDPTFDASATLGEGGSVNALIVLPDGKILVGGYLRGDVFPAPGIARLNADGSPDPSFTPGMVDSNVYAMAVQPDGKIVVGGFFSNFNEANAGGLVRLNSDGSVDGSFNTGSGVDVGVTAVTVQPDGKVLIGGTFTKYRGTARNNIARINADGSIDSTFDPGAGADDYIWSMIVEQDGSITVAGNFRSIANGARTGLARLNSNGSLITSFNPVLENSDLLASVSSMIRLPDGKYIIGGGFTHIDGLDRVGIARLNSNGTVDPSFNAFLHNGDVLGLALSAGGQVVVGGRFTGINGTQRQYVARLGSDGTLDATFDPGSGIAKLATEVHAMAAQADGKVLVGAYDTRGNRSIFLRLNADGSRDESFNPVFNGRVTYAAVQPDGRILVLGAFATINGITRPKVARLNSDGTLDNSFVPPGAVFFDDLSWATLAFQPDGKIVLGGSILRLVEDPEGFYNVSYRRCIRLNADGSVDSTFSMPESAYSGVNSIAVQPDGKVLIGTWEYAYVGEGARIYPIYRLNSNGTTDTSFALSPIFFGEVTFSITTIALQSDGNILVGGGINGGIKRLTNTGGVDNSFQPQVTFTADPKFALQPDGKIVIAGPYATDNGAARNRYGRLNANGSLDTSFEAGVIDGPMGAYSPDLRVVTLAADGRVFLGGAFHSINGALRTLIARIHGDSTSSPNPPPLVTLTGGSPFTVEAGATYTDPGAMAVSEIDGALIPVIIDNTVIPNLPGTYSVTWSAMDSFGTSGTATRTVIVQDTTAPVVSGNFSPLVIEPNSLLPDYLGQVTATDVVGVTSITQSPEPGTAVTGSTVTVTITAHDAADNAGTVNFTVRVSSRDPAILQLQGSPVPNAGVDSRIEAGAAWASFGQPAINEPGQVAYTGKWRGPSQKGLGIFVDDSLIVRVGDPVPGAGTNGLPANAVFKSFLHPVLDDAGGVTFLATIAGLGIRPGNDGVVATNSRGTLEVLAREGDPAPGAANAKFKAFGDVSAKGNGAVLFTAMLQPRSGSPRANSGSDSGAWWRPAGSDALALLVREGDPWMDPTEKIKSIVALESISGSTGHGRALANDQTALIWLSLKSNSGVRHAQAIITPNDRFELGRSGQPLGGLLMDAVWRSLNPASSNDASTYACALGTIALSREILGRTVVSGIFSRQPTGDGWFPEAITGFPVMGLSTEAVFSGFKDPVNSRTDSGIAFAATIKGPQVRSSNNEILAWRSADGAGIPLVVAREGTDVAAGPAGAKWHSFTSIALPGGGLGPLFTAKLQTGAGGITSANDCGLYVLDSTLTVVELLRENQPLGDLVVKRFSVLKAVNGSEGVTRSFNSNREVVATVTFTDGSNGIVKLTVP